MYLPGYVSKEEKENINILEEEKALEVPSKRRPLQSSTLQVNNYLILVPYLQEIAAKNMSANSY